MSSEGREKEDVDFVPPPAELAKSVSAAAEGNKNGDLSQWSGGERESLPQSKEYYCGCGPWHPPLLQVFRDARVFTFLLCLFATIEGALVSGFTSVVLSTLERRYGLSSTATGSIASTFDAAVLVSVVFISYFGSRGHKPRWLGVSLIIQAVGSFVFSLPQFVFGRYHVGTVGQLQSETCLDGEDFSDCRPSKNAVLVFFVFGNLLIGVGAAPLFTVGTSYLDEIIRPKHVSIHLGLFYMLSIVGPALGYALGGPFLSIYVDPWEETHLTTSDPGWVGAWWLCFLFCGVVSLIISVPFFCYPRQLPDSGEIREEREREMGRRCEGVTGVKRGGGSRGKVHSVVVGFLLEVKGILLNPSWVFMTMAISASILVVSGFASFGPKYVETQFGLPASISSLAVGAVAIPTGGAGVVVGGLLIFLLKLKGRRVSLLQLAISFFAILPLLGLLLNCPTPDIAGITATYPDGTTDLPDTRALNSTCISSCNCTSSVFEPVCGADDVVYFSACRAGCPPPADDTEDDFDRCRCVADRLSAVNSSTYSTLLAANSSASDGLCGRDCGLKLGLFLALIGVGLFTVFMLQIPNVIVTIRCVAEDQRTLALGLQSFFWRLCGSIPGPILFGAIFDSTCLFWQHECGRRGNCWVYNNRALSVRAVILAVLAMTGYLFFVFLCWLFYPSSAGPGSREGGQEDDVDTNETAANAANTGTNGVEPAEKEGGACEEEGGAPQLVTVPVVEEEVGVADEHTLSVIGKMQSRNSTAVLLEVDSNRSSSRSSAASTDL